MMGTQCSRPVLRLENVSKIYPTGEVLRNVTWEVKPGDRIGLVGVNGAGKSTQMRLIAGAGGTQQRPGGASGRSANRLSAAGI